MAEAPPIQPDAAAPRPAAPPSGGHDLNALLAEFDTATAKPAEQLETRGGGQLGRQPDDPNGAPQEQQADDGAPPDLDALLNDAASAFQSASVAQPPDVTAELRGKLEPLAHAVAAVQAKQEAAQNKADWESVVKHGKEAVGHFDHISADFAETWLMAESIRNPELTKAFDNRYSSAQAKHWAERQFKKAMFSLYKAAESVPDRQSTEDRAAIVASVTRGSGKAPDPAPPNYGNMTDTELQKEVARLVG